MTSTNHDLDSRTIDATAIASSNGHPAKTARRILLVENHPDALHVMHRLLTASGHDVTCASTLNDALAAVETCIFDFLISDINLPDGDGLSLMKQIHQQQPSIIGIAVTGYGMQEDVSRSLQAGFAVHLTKPVDYPTLQGVMEQLLAPEKQPPLDGQS